MKKIYFFTLAAGIFLTAFTTLQVKMTLNREMTIDSLGACQGVSRQGKRIFLYGDREVGVIREYKLQKDSLLYRNKEFKLTQNGQDLIGHPTGIAYHDKKPVFIGNSVRLNQQGTAWKAVIYCINWPGLLRQGTLDGQVLNTIDDDACIQGTRPEYVQYNDKWYVATADYGDKGNEVRLYDPEKLATCKKTSEPGVLYKKFKCAPWVQNLHWISSRGILVLIQNQVEGRKWRFTYVDLKKSLESGKMQVAGMADLNERIDELEGFTMLNDHDGLAVTSSKKNNVNYTSTSW